MRKFCVMVASVCSLLIAREANAAAYRLGATGQVTGIRLHDYDTGSDSTISGLIGIGDRFNVTATFDTSSVALASLFDADPTINIYWLLGTQTRIVAGEYRSLFTPRFNFSSSVQFWNDRDVVGPTDAQSFSFSNVYYPGPYPFELSKGTLSIEQISIYAFDRTHIVRNSDLISETDLSSNLFGSNSMEYYFLSADGGKAREAVFLNIGSVGWTIKGVPEPTAWAMMIAGFSMVGLATRRRRPTLTSC